MLAIVGDLIADACYETVLEVHSALWHGEFCASCGASHGELVQRDGCDVFGVSVDAQHGAESVQCPHCGRFVQAARFAPHLEKCMGMGRSSARVAKQRVLQPTPGDQQSVTHNGLHLLSPAAAAAATAAAAAAASVSASASAASTTSGANNGSAMDGDGDDDSFESKKRRVSKPAARRESSLASLRSMPPAELASLLRTTCGVLSQASNKMCARALQTCTLHSDQQREAIRQQLLARPAP